MHREAASLFDPSTKARTEREPFFPKLDECECAEILFSGEQDICCFQELEEKTCLLLNQLSERYSFSQKIPRTNGTNEEIPI